MQSHHNRILCVEDHEDTGEMMKALLEMSGYEVALARTVAEGFYLTQSEYLDLCLLDNRLLDESDLELCQQICEIARHGLVLFVSGDAYEAEKLQGSAARAVAYLTKPIKLEELEITMELLINEAMGICIGQA